MKGITFLLLTVATVAATIASTGSRPGHANQEAVAPVFVTTIPPGYRDWKLISVAQEGGGVVKVLLKKPNYAADFEAAFRLDPSLRSSYGKFYQGRHKP